MARIPGISPDQIEDQVVATWARETTDEAIGVYGHSPVAYRKLMHFVEEAKYRGSVPFPLKELVRLKIAEFNQCERCQHYREPSARAATLYSGELYEEYVLPRLEGAVDLTPRERRALEFTEAFAVAHTAIDQAFIERMKEEFSNEELGGARAGCRGISGVGTTERCVWNHAETGR